MRAVVQRVTSASVEASYQCAPPLLPPPPPPLPLIVAAATAGFSLQPCLPCLQVDGEIVGKIGPGLLCLVGLRDTDTDKDAEYMWAVGPLSAGRRTHVRRWQEATASDEQQMPVAGVLHAPATLLRAYMPHQCIIPPEHARF